MVLSFGQVKDEDVSTLIGRKNFAKAIEVIKSQLKNQRPDPRLRLQLGDVLVMAGKNKEAVAILSPLADEFAREGFAAKAISVFKKIQRIDPGARDVDAKLASLIQAKQQQATVPMPAPAHAGLELGMEEIGFEAFGAVSVPVPAAPQPPAPQPPAPQAPAPVEDRDLFAGGMEGTEPEAELGFDVDPPLIERAPTPDAGRDAFAAKARPERQVASTPASTEVELGFLDANTEPGSPGFPAEAVFTLEPEPVLELVPEIVDDVANEVVLSAEVMEAIPEEVPLEEMSESLFADELLSTSKARSRTCPCQTRRPAGPATEAREPATRSW